MFAIEHMFFQKNTLNLKEEELFIYKTNLNQLFSALFDEKISRKIRKNIQKVTKNILKRTNLSLN